ncbi:MAG: Cna domain protein [Candidatus Solibacter sp.]|nr:Cna domain protein [Candidatus Solibacter sp.]
MKMLFLMAALILPHALDAQVLYGSITGNVTDKSGAVVPGARAEALNVDTGVSRQTLSDEHGTYAFGDLQAGKYRVTIQAQGLSKLVQENIELESNTVRRVDAALDVAVVNESVFVTMDASTVSLQTDRVEVNTQIPQRLIEDMPLPNSRNFQSLLDLVPGVSPPAASHSEAGNPTGALATNVNGTSYNNNGTRVDGAVNGYPWLPEIIAYVPPAEAIQGVSVSTGNYDAEQGMAGGSAVNVTMKSGTNSFHGAAWEYNTISALKARNFFYKGGPNNPKYINNQFGATFGGPIKKNKLFFFWAYERMMKRQAASAFQSVPLAQIRQGDFSITSTVIYDPQTGNADGTGRTQFPGNKIPANRFNSAAVQMAALLPLPTQGGTSSNYFAIGHYYFNKYSSDIKINYTPSERSTVFGRYSFLPYDIFDPPSLGAAGGAALNGGQPGHAVGTVRNTAVGGTYTISPTLLVDGAVGYTRQSISGRNVDIGTNFGSDVLKIPGTNGSLDLQGGIPFFSVSGWTSFGNPNVSNPFVFRDNQYTVSGNASWIKPKHSMRFGFDYVRYGINHFQPQLKYGARGGFAFTGGLTTRNGGAASNAYNGWADFLLGLPQAMGKDYQFINPGTVRESSVGLYARDQFQVHKNLTITYGLRYEFYPLSSRDHFGFDRYDPTTNQVLLGGLGGVPRNTGVDAGLGVIAPRLGVAWRLGQKTVIRAGYGITVDPNNFRAMRDAYPAVISQQLSGLTSYRAAGSLETGLPPVDFPDINTGKLVFPAGLGTTTYPTSIHRGYIQSYNFTLQRQIGSGINLQAGYVGTRSVRQFAHVNINAAAPGTGNAGRPLNVLWGNSSDIVVVEPYNSSRYNSLQTQASKRFHGGSQIRLAYTFSRAIDYGDNSDSSLTWAWGPMQYRNKALAGYDRTHNLKLFGTYDLPFGRGHQLFNRGIAKMIAGGWQVNAIMSRVSGSPFTVGSSGTSLNAPGNTQTADQILPDVEIFGGVTGYFDTKAFASVTGVRFGNSGRNILRGPGYFNLDSSVFRSFRVREGVRIQFRAEAFGATNTPRFANPSATVTSGGFGNITSSSGERQLRFAMKLNY